jgi:hypothetical protein
VSIGERREDGSDRPGSVEAMSKKCGGVFFAMVVVVVWWKGKNVRRKLKVR